MLVSVSALGEPLDSDRNVIRFVGGVIENCISGNNTNRSDEDQGEYKNDCMTMQELISALET